MTCTIPIGSRGQYEVTVDEADYAFLTQWKWTFKTSSWTFGAKIYARRCSQIGKGSSRQKITIYMHPLILQERMLLPQPTPDHEGDHIDRDSLNNTQDNLRWATKGEQNANQGPRITQSQKVAYAVAATLCGAEMPF
jgi:hypothetical protein